MSKSYFQYNEQTGVEKVIPFPAPPRVESSPATQGYEVIEYNQEQESEDTITVKIPTLEERELLERYFATAMLADDQND